MQWPKAIKLSTENFSLQTLRSKAARASTSPGPARYRQCAGVRRRSYKKIEERSKTEHINSLSFHWQINPFLVGCRRFALPNLLWGQTTLLASERSERAQSCSCSIEISDTYVSLSLQENDGKGSPG